jgi:hypothetical protein
MYRLTHFARLFKNTPHLRRFNTILVYLSNKRALQSPVPLIVTFDAVLCTSGKEMTEKLFQNMPNLYNLYIDSVDLYMDGH